MLVDVQNVAITTVQQLRVVLEKLPQSIQVD